MTSTGGGGGKCSLEVSRLIAEVNRRPELWDRQHPQHHNRSVLDHHWDCVAASLDITGKAARGKWKNLKDHFRKEYKRCTSSANADQEVSKWPYFYSMMFIREQISHAATADSSAAVYHRSDFRDFGGRNAVVYDAGPEVTVLRRRGGGGGAARGGDWPVPADRNCGDSGGGGYNNRNDGDDDDDDDDDDDGYRPLDCLHVEYGGGNGGNRPADDVHQDDNDRPPDGCSDDKHFLLSLVPILSALSPDKKLRARIAVETSLLNVAYPAEQNDGPRSTPVHEGVVQSLTASPTTPDRNATPRTTTPRTTADPNATTTPDDDAVAVVKTECDTTDTTTTPCPPTTPNTTCDTATTTAAIKAEYSANAIPPRTTLNAASADSAATATTTTCTAVKAEYAGPESVVDDRTYRRPQKRVRKCH